MAVCLIARAPRLTLVAAASVAVLMSAHANAQTLADPTRPAFADAAPSSTGVGALPDSRLSSIVRPRSGKPHAVIDGKVVRLGEAVGDARLSRIDESSVELRTAQGRETLTLTPAAGKTPAIRGFTGGRNPS